MKTSKTAGSLAARILALLVEHPRPAHWFRSFASTEAVFEQAIGRLFLRGQVKFKGRKKSRRLVRSAG